MAARARTRARRRRGTRAACVPCRGLESVEARDLGCELEVVGQGVRVPGRLGRGGVLVLRRMGEHASPLPLPLSLVVMSRRVNTG